MIDHHNHYTRYNELMSLAASFSPSRQNDGGYMAALYILSADNELYKHARPRIGSSGINFSGLLTAARRAGLSDSQIIAARSAHNLFNGGSGNTAPYDLVLCDYCTLDIIADALYIWKGGRTPTADSSGQMYLDCAAERRHRNFCLDFACAFQKQPMDDCRNL